MTKALYNIVGTKYRGADAVAAVNALRRGQALRLIREPGNKFDPFAVQVWIDGVTRLHIGFVKGVESPKLAQMMDRLGGAILGRFAVTPDGWPQVEVDE